MYNLSLVADTTCKIKKLQTKSQAILHPQIIYMKAEVRGISETGRKENGFQMVRGTGRRQMLPHFASPVLSLKFRVLIVFYFLIVIFCSKKPLAHMHELYLLVMVLCNVGSLRKMKMSGLRSKIWVWLEEACSPAEFLVPSGCPGRWSGCSRRHIGFGAHPHNLGNQRQQNPPPGPTSLWIP